jgi:pectate lyase
MTPPAPSTLIGWATQGSGTTGGGTATPMVVTNASQFMSAAGGNNAAVVHLNGNIQGTFTIGSNKTIVGVCGATITGALNLNGVQNVIVRNLKMVGFNCSDSPQDCSGGDDAIGVNGGAHHIWFDHLDVSNGSDGNLDITQGADFVTVSWTKFSYSTMRTDPVSGDDGHRFSNLIGSSDTDPADVGHLNVTWHHNWWADNVDQRMPRSRRGQIHVLNNLYTAAGNLYCTNAGQDARLLVENNIYIGVNSPLQTSGNGNMRSVGNVFTMTMGNTSASGTGFTPTYVYTADPTSGLEAAIRAGVGPK